MNIHHIITIVKKEVLSLLNSVTSYIVLVVFLVLWEFLFFRNAFLAGEASLRLLYDVLPWVMLLLVPAVTMGSVSREKDEGTLEVLLTHPLREIELIIGKWLGAVAFVTCALLFAVPIAASFSFFGHFDWGMFLGQFVASVFVAGAFASLGLFISSLLSSQIASLLVTVASGFFLIIIGTEFVTANLPLSFVPVFERLSLLSHVDSMSRGVLDTRDAWYFLSFIAVFLGLAYLEFMKRKYGNLKMKYASFQLGIGLFVGIAILTNILGERIPGRTDLTSERLYTLSDGTKQILQNLPDVVTITLYASGKLPPQHAPIVREVKDMLRDFKTRGGSKIIVVNRDPSADPLVAQEAGSRGIQEVQFNVIGSEEFQVKTGYLGLTIEYAGKHETLPFIRDTSDLEYQLTSNIRKLTVKEKKSVQFLSGHDEKSVFNDYRIVSQELEKQFDVKTDARIATEASVLVIAGPSQKLDEAGQKEVKDFIEHGKSVFYLVDTFTVSPKAMSANLVEQNANSILSEYGITIAQNIVYDLRSNELVNFGGNGVMNYLLPYPFWLRALPAKSDSTITRRLGGVLLPWTSSIGIDDGKAGQKGYTVQKLLTTSSFAGEKSGTVSITPDSSSFSRENLSEKVLAVSLRPKEKSKLGKLIVVGDADFLSDQFLENSPGNISFGLSAMSWLSEDEGVAAIRVRKGTIGKLLLRNELDAAFIKYGNIAFAIFFPITYGAWRLIRRRNLRVFPYRA